VWKYTCAAGEEVRLSFRPYWRLRPERGASSKTHKRGADVLLCIHGEKPKPTLFPLLEMQSVTEKIGTVARRPADARLASRGGANEPRPYIEPRYIEPRLTLVLFCL